MNITEFLTKNAAMCSNRTNFMSLFNRVMEEGVLVRCEFTKGATWFKWAAPNGTKKL